MNKKYRKRNNLNQYFLIPYFMFFIKNRSYFLQIPERKRCVQRGVARREGNEGGNQYIQERI